MLIYRMTNLVNGKSYVGLTTNMLRRIAAHKASAKRGSLLPIHAALRKYGVDGFLIETVACARSFDDLKAVEVAIIAQERTCEAEFGYNLTAGGDGLFGFKRPPEFGEAMRARYAGRPISDGQKAKIRAALLGRKASVASREARTGVPGRLWTEKQKQAASERQKGRPLPEQQRVSLLGHSVSDATKAAVAQANANRVWSDAARQKNRDAATGRVQSTDSREKRRVAMTGRKHSTETIAKMKARVFSDATRRKMSDAARARCDRVQADRQADRGKQASGQ